MLIALEFNHTLLGVLERRHGIVQVRTVVLIAPLAIARKSLILDLGGAERATLLGLAGAAPALGGAYWLAATRTATTPQRRPPTRRAAPPAPDRTRRTLAFSERKS